MDGVMDYDEYFRLNRDCFGMLQFSSIREFFVVVRILAYGGYANQFDKYICIGESTCLAMYHLWNGGDGVWKGILARTKFLRYSSNHGCGSYRRLF
jgi:hypothetical protein